MSCQHDPFDPTPQFIDRLVRRLREDLGFKPDAITPELVRHRLLRRARTLGTDLQSYFRMIVTPKGYANERTHIFDAITTNTTSFFREPTHFHALRGPLLDSLLENRSGSRLKIWSAASSNGAEAYSAAMSLKTASHARGFRYAVLGTDISTKMIEEARIAIYDAAAVVGVPEEMSKRFIRHSISDPTRIRIAPDIRRHVRFSQMNLTDAHYPVDSDVDVIMLRNVLIYFDKDVREHVIEQLSSHLRPGGFLILGHSEANAALDMGLENCGSSIFQKPAMRSYGWSMVA